MKNKLSKLSRKMKFAVKSHDSEILMGIGIAGMITTVVMAVKATPKALELIDEKKEELEVETLKVQDIVATTWKCYIPTAVTGTLSVACLIGSNSISSKRKTALATAYKLSESTFREYREKVVDKIGDKKEKEIRDEVAKDKLQKNPVGNNSVIITEKGNTLFYDPLSDRYFKSDIDKIKKIINELNRQMLEEMCVSLNEYYYELGLHSTSIGDEMGWNIDNGLIDINYSAQLTDEDVPCIVLDHFIPPKYDFMGNHYY